MKLLLKKQFSLFIPHSHHFFKESDMCGPKLKKWQRKEDESTHETNRGLGHKHGSNCKGYTGISHFKRKLFTLTSSVSQHQLYFGELFFSPHSFSSTHEENGANILVNLKVTWKIISILKKKVTDNL